MPVLSALDALNQPRSFSCSEDEDGFYLNSDKVSTFDYRRTVNGHSDSIPQNYEPKVHIRNPPHPWDPVGVSAHANVIQVEKFLQDKLEHNSLDLENEELSYSSFVYFPGDTAFWHPGTKRNVFVYGKSSEEKTYASAISIVAHEIFHGITHFTSKLESREQSGALNESYSDIFGVILNNHENDDVGTWNWEIGIPGFPVRDLSHPTMDCGQGRKPIHMDNYRQLSHQKPLDSNDRGWIHCNNAIHNKAAFNLLTYKDAGGNYLFNVDRAALLFYSALINLEPKSNFSDSKLKLIIYADRCFDKSKHNLVVEAINKSFDSVGIR